MQNGNIGQYQYLNSHGFYHLNMTNKAVTIFKKENFIAICFLSKNLYLFI